MIFQLHGAAAACTYLKSTQMKYRIHEGNKRHLKNKENQSAIAGTMLFCWFK